MRSQGKHIIRFGIASLLLFAGNAVPQRAEAQPAPAPTYRIASIDFELRAALRNALIAQPVDTYINQVDISNPGDLKWKTWCVNTSSTTAVLDQTRSLNPGDNSKPPMITFVENSNDNPRYPMSMADLRSLAMSDASGTTAPASTSPSCLHFYPQFFTAYPNARYVYSYTIYGLDWQDNQLVDSYYDTASRAIPFRTVTLNSSKSLPAIPNLPGPRNVKPVWTVVLKRVSSSTQNDGSITLTNASPTLNGYNSFSICDAAYNNCWLKIDKQH